MIPQHKLSVRCDIFSEDMEVVSCYLTPLYINRGEVRMNINTCWNWVWLLKSPMRLWGWTSCRQGSCVAAHLQIKGIVHRKMKMPSFPTHHFADGGAGEVFESTEHIWSFRGQKPYSQIQYNWKKLIASILLLWCQSFSVILLRCIARSGSIASSGSIAA